MQCVFYQNSINYCTKRQQQQNRGGKQTESTTPKSPTKVLNSCGFGGKIIFDVYVYTHARAHVCVHAC